MSFILQYAQEPPADPSIPAMRYDPVLQLNVMPDGTPAVADLPLLRESMTTTSTAGSKTHF